MNTKRILIVDDVTANIQTIVKFLEESGKGYQLMSAINGKMALKVVQKHKPDLIITDWEMPEMDGEALLNHLQADPLLKDIPCIMVTGTRTDVKDLQRAFAHGALDFIRKPIHKVELWARVASILKLFDAYQTINDQKDRELSTQTLQLHQKNQLLKDIQEKTEKVMLEMEVSARQPIKEILRLLKDNITLDNQWDNFKLHFESVHPNFFKELSVQFPSLSQNDHKLCAYIRIGFSSKEIASLFNIDPASLRKTRMRLKKKMELPQEVDLVDFILNK